MRRAVTIGAFLLLAIMVGRAQAELFDRGNGLIYESVFDLSWTQNAAPSGLNDWASQKTLADNLVLAGFDDFILATRGDLESLYIRLPGADGSNKTGNQGPFVVGLSAAERWRAATRVSVSTPPTARPQRQPGTRRDVD